MSSPIGNKFTGTGLSNSDEDRRQSAPPVIRQLKPPPEIWELVHPVTSSKAKRGRPFLSRVMSKWTALVILAFVVGTAAGVGVALWNHPAARSFLSAPQTQVATPQQQPVSPAPASAELAPATSNDGQPIADSTTPPAVVSNETQPEASENTTRPSVKKGFVPRQVRTPDAALGVRVGSPTSTNNQRPTEPAVAPQQSSTESTSKKPKSETAEGSQVITPVKPAPTSKPKVIPWP